MSQEQGQEGERLESTESFHVQQTYPVPQVLFERLTGFPSRTEPSLGVDTETVHWELTEDELPEFFFHVFQDIFHDSQGARSGEGTRMSDFFNVNGRGLNHFAECFLYGMNAFYGNVVPSGEGRKPESWERKLTTAMFHDYFFKGKKTYSSDITSVQESKALEDILLDLKTLHWKQGDTSTRAFYTQYTTDQVLKSAHPYLVSYDAGSDLLHSVLGRFDYVDISIVNVKDPGDSLRTRNKLLASIEKIVSQRPGVETGRLIQKLRQEAKAAPGEWQTRIEAFLEHVAAPGGLGEGLNTQTFYMHQYLTQRAVECIRKGGRDKAGQLNLIADVSKPLTSEAILMDYKKYMNHKLATIFGEEKFAIHKKNVRLVVACGAWRLLDVEYRFDEGRMWIQFHGDEKILGVVRRENLNSAKDVGRRFKETVSQTTTWGDRNTALQPGHHLLEVVLAKLTSTVSLRSPLTYPSKGAGMKPIPTEWLQRLTAQLYVECMYKFIGDFSQVMYGYYLGSVFASFDRSAITMALFTMKSLLRSPAHYRRFKMGEGKADDAVVQERMARGLLLLTSTTYHRKGVPRVSYYADIRAAVNIEQGLQGKPSGTSIKAYLDAMGVERLDEEVRPPALAALSKAVRRRAKAPLRVPSVEKATVVEPSARALKKQWLQAVEAERMKSVEDKELPVLMRALLAVSKENPWDLFDVDLDEGVVYQMPTTKHYMSWIRTVVRNHLKPMDASKERVAAFFIERLDARLKSMRAGRRFLDVPPNTPWVMIGREHHPAVSGFVKALDMGFWKVDTVERLKTRLEDALASARVLEEWVVSQLKYLKTPVEAPKPRAKKLKMAGGAALLKHLHEILQTVVARQNTWNEVLSTIQAHPDTPFDELQARLGVAVGKKRKRS